MQKIKEKLLLLKEKLLGLVKQLKANKRLSIIVLVAICLAAGGGFYYWRTSSRPVGLPEEVQQAIQKGEQQVEVLPTKERILKNTDTGYLEDPFAAPMVLLGVVQGRDKEYATVRSGNTVWNASSGDIIAGAWKIEEIYLDRIYLSSDDREIILKLE